MATIVPKSGFNEAACEAASKALHDSMKGLGTNEASIIKVLTSHSNAQRQEIAQQYKTEYGKDLVESLKSELGGPLEETIVALMTPTWQYLAHELRDAMKGPGTDESTLIEILCRSNAEIKAIKSAYEALYPGRSLEKDVVKETGGNFERLLVSQVNAGRDESPQVDRALAEKDAKAIWDAGEKKLGTDESVFNQILCERSYAQLKATFESYQKQTGKGILDTIKRELSGPLRDGFANIVNFCWDQHYFFAERIYMSMKGAGTNDKQLIRNIISRSEIDLATVSQSFQKQYGKSLSDWIKSDIGGEYRNALLAILGNH